MFTIQWCVTTQYDNRRWSVQCWRCQECCWWTCQHHWGNSHTCDYVHCHLFLFIYSKISLASTSVRSSRQGPWVTEQQCLVTLTLTLSSTHEVNNNAVHFVQIFKFDAQIYSILMFRHRWQCSASWANWIPTMGQEAACLSQQCTGPELPAHWNDATLSPVHLQGEGGGGPTCEPLLDWPTWAVQVPTEGATG